MGEIVSHLDSPFLLFQVGGVVAVILGALVSGVLLVPPSGELWMSDQTLEVSHVFLIESQWTCSMLMHVKDTEIPIFLMKGVCRDTIRRGGSSEKFKIGDYSGDESIQLRYSNTLDTTTESAL
jgi:hypothetical protein